jgi:hypothetical protein
MAFAEPEVIATFDRSWGDKKEELRLERGEYQGKSTFALRLYWQTPDGQWRWAAQKPTQSGKCWERLNLKGRELRELGEALVRASTGANDNAEIRRSKPGGFPLASIGNDDDIPF